MAREERIYMDPMHTNMTHLMFQQNLTRPPSPNGCILVGSAATQTLNQPGHQQALLKQSQTCPKPMRLSHLPSPFSKAIFMGHIYRLTHTLPALLRPLLAFNSPPSPRIRRRQCRVQTPTPLSLSRSLRPPRHSTQMAAPRRRRSSLLRTRRIRFRRLDWTSEGGS